MNLEELLDAAMVADIDGGPWEQALAEALDAALKDMDTGNAIAILEEYRAAQARMAEDGKQ